jgi:DNA-binding FadR family transcriptional regulator
VPPDSTGSGPPSSRSDFTVSVAEMVARELESQITSGVLQPGERLGTKEDLRKRFGVAEASVNEATKLLMMRGLLTARPGPGGGLFATKASTRVQLNHLALGQEWVGATIADYIHVRGALEPLVCREAAGYHRNDDSRALQRLLANMEEQLDQPLVYMRQSWALHRRIASICRNALLQGLYLTVLDFLEDALERAELWPQDGVEHLARHRELVEAIDSGPGARLEAAIVRHEPTWILRQATARTKSPGG